MLTEPMGRVSGLDMLRFAVAASVMAVYYGGRHAPAAQASGHMNCVPFVDVFFVITKLGWPRRATEHRVCQTAERHTTERAIDDDPGQQVRPISIR